MEAKNTQQKVDREEEIDLIVDLLKGEKRRSDNTTPIKWLFGIIIGAAVLMGIILGVSHVYEAWRTKSVGEGGFKVEALNLKDQTYLLSKSDIAAFPDKQEGYLLFLPDGGWYDSGIWVNAGFQAVIKTTIGKEKQPFIVKIGNKEIPATLNSDNLYFIARVTPEAPSKLIFRLSGDATIRYVNLEVWILRTQEAK